MRVHRKVQTLGFILGVAALPLYPGEAHADEAHADQLLQAMSTYMAALDAFSFDFDIEHEVVSPDGEKFGLQNSGSVDVDGPGALSFPGSGASGATTNSADTCWGPKWILGEHT